LGAKDIESVRDSDAGPVLADRIIELMKRLEIPNGLQALGFTSNDIDALVEGALPQHRHATHISHIRAHVLTRQLRATQGVEARAGPDGPGGAGQALPAIHADLVRESPQQPTHTTASRQATAIASGSSVKT
jgi:hypothetical protein